MKKLFNKFLVLLAFTLALAACVSQANAAAGVGISPTKIVLRIESGSSQESSVLVFNSGDYPMEITLSSDGEIASFTQITPGKEVIDPEPMPHSLPIKNGKAFVITFSPPATNEAKKYVGSISATGSPGGGTFGGSVGVAMQVELTVVPAPAKPLFGFLTTTHVLMLLVVAAALAAIVFFKKYRK